MHTFKELETINPNEFELYFVKPVIRNEEEWYQLGFECSEGEVEHIIGLPKSEKSKAFLEYWCMRLNRAFVNGYFAAKGKSSYPSEGYYKELNELYKIAFNK